MDFHELSYVQDLTRRYARHRPCAAGLGLVWVMMVLEFLLGLILGGALRRLELAGWGGSWHDLLRPWPASTRLLWMLALAPVLAGLGLRLLQVLVDRRFGRVSARPEPGADRFRTRWSGPLAVTLWTGLWLLYSGLLAPERLAGARILDPTRCALLAGVVAWSWLWGWLERDRLSHQAMTALSLPCSLLLIQNLQGDRLVLLMLYAVAVAFWMVKGLRRFSSFLQVSQELAARDQARP